jgi:hypothetical protein
LAVNAEAVGVDTLVLVITPCLVISAAVFNLGAGLSDGAEVESVVGVATFGIGIVSIISDVLVNAVGGLTVVFSTADVLGGVSSAAVV